MSKLDQIRALREQRYTETQSRPVNNMSVINKSQPVINAAPSVTRPTNAQRQAKWRKANEALNRERAREGMRKRRAQQKD